MLVAESSYQDATILVGPDEWYGRNEAELTFPGNLSPAATLTANSQTGASNRYYIHVQASASDPDGAADISSIALTLTDGKGRTLKQWSLSDFSKSDNLTWTFESSYRVSGKEPWTLTMVVKDRSGQSATQSVTITR
jgi:hypothetical protein